MNKVKELLQNDGIQGNKELTTELYETVQRGGSDAVAAVRVFQQFANRSVRIAVQNQGRLMAPSLAYLKKCGLKFSGNGRSLVVPCQNADIELLMVRSSDIPEYVRYGVADFGIVGRNVLMEKENNLKMVRELDFGKCSLVIAVPKNSKMKNLNDLDHERIATSYPRILKDFLKKQGISAAIIEIRGSVEICPSLGLADAVFDITQTGRTLKENGLKVLVKVADSQAVLIRNSNPNLTYEDLFV